ncbi:hypothetical protein M2132_000848 [Dysgonomonas sp. PH5-45]|uniref:T9SS type A sorting domain-containing protein n=1 Tax=unclassified Dysgonomonas TaxID=2630389 RepID=UPI002476D23C|nr:MULTISPECIES: T9SS type A sorting domain-containing protein [unclassified Dysgonomonas]MDH6354520.1 hypothetical protein [Dysgonomonas sp. PH5-45]MDH6387424.1 hypothetical protein [Dysgonomonas sp. PH5-37]
MKKLTFTLCLLLAFCSVWAKQAVDFTDGDGSESNPYQITNRQQLESLKYYLGEEHGDLHFRLMNDIDLSGEFWAPIGQPDTLDFTNTFCGKLHGGGFKIKNIRINLSSNADDYCFAGLFGALYAGAYIDSLHIIGGNIQGGGKHYSYTGAIAGYVSTKPQVGSDVNIYACGSSAEVFGGSAGLTYTGGIVGKGANYSPGRVSLTISNCTNNGQVWGGIDSYSASYTGGIVGEASGFGINSGTAAVAIEGCINIGMVTGGEAYSSFTGGIAGYSEAAGFKTASGTVSFTDCNNIGAVISSKGNTLCTGGILGYGNSFRGGSRVSGLIEMERCCNSGSIRTGVDREESFAGGILGYGYAAAADNLEGVVIHLNDCYNHNEMTVKEENSYAGGLAGYFTFDGATPTVTIENSYAGGDIFVDGANVGGLVGYINNTIGAATIQNCVAAQAYIEGRETSRILGCDIPAGVTLKNNYANEAMLVNGQTITSTDAASGDGADKPMSELYTQAAYTAIGWDFSGTWAVRSDNRALPYFQWQSAPVVIDGWQSADVTLNLISASERVEVYKEGTAELIGVFNGLQAGDNILQLKGVKEGDVLTFINYETGKPASYGVRGIAEGTSSITEDGSHPAGITVYPNVLNSGEEVRILSAEPLATTARLYNVSGQLLQTVQLKGTQATLRVEEPQGVYLLVINGQAVKLVVR